MGFNTIHLQTMALNSKYKYKGRKMAGEQEWRSFERGGGD